MRVQVNGETYKVVWRHMRALPGHGQAPGSLNPRGGSTECEIYRCHPVAPDMVVAWGWSVCSNEDSFCKDTGRRTPVATA